MLPPAARAVVALCAMPTSLQQAAAAAGGQAVRQARERRLPARLQDDEPPQRAAPPQKKSAAPKRARHSSGAGATASSAAKRPRATAKQPASSRKKARATTKRPASTALAGTRGGASDEEHAEREAAKRRRNEEKEAAAAQKEAAAAQKLAEREAAKRRRKEERKAAAAEQRELRAAEKQQKQAQRKAAKEGAKEERRQARRVPPSASDKTATPENVLELLASAAQTFAGSDPDDAAARRRLLAPVLAPGEDEESSVPAPSAELLKFAERLQTKLHTAYGDATELPAAQHADANLQLRLDAVGSAERRALSAAWLALPGVDPGERGGAARLSLFWTDVLTEFKRAQQPAGFLAAPELPTATEDAGDRQVMAVVGGWAVFSLRAVLKKGAVRLRPLLRLLEKLILQEGPGSEGLTDPATLYLLARQQFGGLTALTPNALTFFDLAQRVLASHLTKERIAQAGVHTFQIGVNAVLSDAGVTAAFEAQMPADSTREQRLELRRLLLQKFFNQAGAEFCKQA